MKTGAAKLIKRMFTMTTVGDAWIAMQARRLGISKSEYLRRVIDKDRDSTAK